MSLYLMERTISVPLEGMNWLQPQLLLVLTLGAVVMYVTLHNSQDVKPHCRLYTYHTYVDKSVPLSVTAIRYSKIDLKNLF